MAIPTSISSVYASKWPLVQDEVVAEKCDFVFDGS